MENYNTVGDAIKGLNKMRLNNKNKWVMTHFSVNGLNYSIKFFGTWIQILRMQDSNINHASNMEISVTDFKAHLKNALMY